MLDIFLIRHGQTDANISGFIMGQGEYPINNYGRSQAVKISKFLKDVEFKALYVSPSKRAMQTAQILMKGRDSLPFVEDPNLDEIAFGDWIGKMMDDIRGSDDYNNYMWKPSTYTVPQGEHIPDVQARAVAVVEKIQRKYNVGKVVIVSHADVIKAILNYYLKMPLDRWQTFRIDNCSLSILRFAEDREPRAITVNCHEAIEKYCT